MLVVSLAACGGETPAPIPPQPAQQEAQPQAAPTQPAAPTGTQVTQQEAAAPAAGGLDGKALVTERCTKCHGIARVEGKKANADGWKSTVERMMSKGAKLSDAEKQAVIDYLAQTYPQ